MSTKKIVTAVLGTVLAAAVLTAEAKSGTPPVQCYGIAKTHQNDCGTPAHACAAQASSNYSPIEYKFEPTAAACAAAGGNLKPGLALPANNPSFAKTTKK